MKKYRVSKELRKYAYAKIPSLLDRADLLHYADKVKRLEERLFESEKELAWKNAHDTEEHIIDLQKKLSISENRVKAWQEAMKSDCPWEAEFKHKADIAILSYKLEKTENMLILMMPLSIRKSFWIKSGEIGKTKFYMRKY